MINLKKHIFVLGIILFILPVYANNPHLTNIYREDYQAGNKNWAIGQDERSILYFANDIGLLEFDGIEWRLNELPNKLAIRSVAVLSHNTLFTGSYEEFGRWDRDLSGKLVYTSLSDKIDPSLFRNDDFWKIWIVDQLVYFQSFTSIYIYDYKTVKQIPSNFAFLFLFKVRNEFLVQEMLGSIYRLKGLKLEKIEGSDLFNNADVRVILPYQEDKYLIGTAGKGIYIYDGKTFYEWNNALSKIMITKELNCGIRTSKGLFYFGTISDGIYIVDTEGTIISHLSSKNTLQNNTILALLEDDLNNVWAALDQGITYIRYMDNMSCYTDPSGNMGAVYAAAIRDDKLYIGTNQGVLYIKKEDLLQLNSLRSMKLIDGTQGQVWALKVVNGKLYCCHNKGLKEIHNDLTVTDSESINTGVYDLMEFSFKDRKRLFLSTYVSLRIMDERKETVYTLPQISEPVRNVEIDHLGNIWLEHANKGIYRCKLNDDCSDFTGISSYGGGRSDSLPYKLKMFKVGGRIELLGNDCFYSYNDIEDKIILNKPLNECFKKITHLKQIVHINDYTFWALTNHSIYKFFYDGYKAFILENYDLETDLSLVNTNENIAILDDSTHLICLDNGFLLYKQSSTMTYQTAARAVVPHIESLLTANASGKELYVDLSSYSRIPHTYNRVVFRFSAPTTFVHNLSFQYRLKGVDLDWSNPERVNKVSYDRLPKGKYEFQVRTIDSLGNYSDYVVYKFEITPPWFQTIGAYVSYALLLFVLVYLTKILIVKRARNLHLQKIKKLETEHLKVLTEKLRNEVETKNAELFTQSSFIIQKNELILKIKNMIGDFYSQNRNSSLIPLHQKLEALLDSNLNSEDDWNRFLIKFEEKHTHFFKGLKMQYPQLTNIDLRLCACLKLNMETKEIASLMNLSVRAVENSRYRLRKKLSLQPSQNLNEFFLCVD